MMGRDVNSMTIVGTVNRPVRVSPTKNGSVANVSVETKRVRGDRSFSTYHDVTCWNTLADVASTLAEGDRVYVTGSISTDSWEGKDGQKQYKKIVTASSFGKIESGASSDDLEDKFSKARPQGGPPGSFSSGGGKKSTFPYADTAHKVSWPKPDDSGFSYADDGVAQLCVAWADPTDPSKGGTVYQFADDEWMPYGEVDTVLFTDDDIPF